MAWSVWDETLDKDIRNGEFDTFLKLFVLMCADDPILLADNEIDMQKLLDSIYAFFNIINYK